LTLTEHGQQVGVELAQDLVGDGSELARAD
jgi:hypothetical protein